MRRFFILQFICTFFAIMAYSGTYNGHEKLRSIKAKMDLTDPALTAETASINKVLFSDKFLRQFNDWKKHYDYGAFGSLRNPLSSELDLMDVFDNEAYWILVNAGPCILSNLAPLTSKDRFSAAWFLWLNTTRTRAVKGENPWFDEPFDYLWKAGTECADKRVLFLLSEWRTALSENRVQDANHAKLALIAQGIFAYHALFQEIELGREDVWIILENTSMPYPGMRMSMTHEEWMDWWRDHKTEYVFKSQYPESDQSPHLEKWQRIGR